MIYENMKEAMALNYHQDGIFIALSEGKTSHVVTSHLWIFWGSIITCSQEKECSWGNIHSPSRV